MVLGSAYDGVFNWGMDLGVLITGIYLEERIKTAYYAVFISGKDFKVFITGRLSEGMS